MPCELYGIGRVEFNSGLEILYHVAPSPRGGEGWDEGVPLDCPLPRRVWNPS